MLDCIGCLSVSSLVKRAVRRPRAARAAGWGREQVAVGTSHPQALGAVAGVDVVVVGLVGEVGGAGELVGAAYVVGAGGGGGSHVVGDEAARGGGVDYGAAVDLPGVEGSA